MRTEIKRIHQTLGLTTVYVTHDQEEALSPADRLVVLRDGRVQQVGTPEEVYAQPHNRYVAGFMGYRNEIELPVTASDGNWVTLATVLYKFHLAGALTGVILANLVPSVPFVILTMTPVAVASAPVDGDASATARLIRPEDQDIADPGAGNCFPVRDGDVAAIRSGYHPVVAAPGYAAVLPVDHGRRGPGADAVPRPGARVGAVPVRSVPVRSGQSR